MDMQPTILKLFWNLNVQGVVHAGAHKGEELQTYERLGFGPVTWIEAIPDLANELALRVQPPSNVINSALWSVPDKKLKFQLTSASASSSLFDLQDLRIKYPEISVVGEIEVVTQTIDQLDLGAGKNLLVLDLQGAEYEAITGAHKTLRSMDYILTEVNKVMLYKGIKLVGDLDNLLMTHDFVRVATRWTKHGWGEALYLRISINQKNSMKRLQLIGKVFLYRLWLNLFEIPIVYLRSKVNQVLPSRSKAR
jgi:FkbM family methyltransferase